MTSASFIFGSKLFLPAVEKWLGRNPPAGPSFFVEEKALFPRRKGRWPCREGARVYETGRDDEGLLVDVVGGLIGFMVF
jgi:hypothetical protein